MVTIGFIEDLQTGLIYHADNVELKINDQSIRQLGAVYLLERALVFVLANSNEGISIPWPRISLHAIQNNNGVRKVYFMIESEIIWPGIYGNNVQNNGNDIDDDSNDEGHESDASELVVTEFWLFPMQGDNETIVNQMFNGMKQCQSLHPDPNDSISEEDFMEAEDNDEAMDGENQMRNLNLDGN